MNFSQTEARIFNATSHYAANIFPEIFAKAINLNDKKHLKSGGSASGFRATIEHLRAISDFLNELASDISSDKISILHQQSSNISSFQLALKKTCGLLNQILLPTVFSNGKRYYSKPSLNDIISNDPFCDLHHPISGGRMANLGEDVLYFNSKNLDMCENNIFTSVEDYYSHDFGTDWKFDESEDSNGLPLFEQDVTMHDVGMNNIAKIHSALTNKDIIPTAGAEEDINELAYLLALQEFEGHFIIKDFNNAMNITFGIVNDNKTLTNIIRKFQKNVIPVLMKSDGFTTTSKTNFTTAAVAVDLAEIAKSTNEQTMSRLLASSGQNFLQDHAGKNVVLNEYSEGQKQNSTKKPNSLLYFATAFTQRMAFCRREESKFNEFFAGKLLSSNFNMNNMNLATLTIHSFGSSSAKSLIRRLHHECLWRSFFAGLEDSQKKIEHTACQNNCQIFCKIGAEYNLHNKTPNHNIFATDNCGMTNNFLQKQAIPSVDDETNFVIKDLSNNRINKNATDLNFFINSMPTKDGDDISSSTKSRGFYSLAERSLALFLESSHEIPSEALHESCLRYIVDMFYQESEKNDSSSSNVIGQQNASSCLNKNQSIVDDFFCLNNSASKNMFSFGSPLGDFCDHSSHPHEKMLHKLIKKNREFLKWKALFRDEKFVKTKLFPENEATKKSEEFPKFEEALYGKAVDCVYDPDGACEEKSNGVNTNSHIEKSSGANIPKISVGDNTSKVEDINQDDHVFVKQEQVSDNNQQPDNTSTETSNQSQKKSNIIAGSTAFLRKSTLLANEESNYLTNEKLKLMPFLLAHLTLRLSRSRLVLREIFKSFKKMFFAEEMELLVKFDGYEAFLEDETDTIFVKENGTVKTPSSPNKSDTNDLYLMSGLNVKTAASEAEHESHNNILPDNQIHQKLLDVLHIIDKTDHCKTKPNPHDLTQKFFNQRFDKLDDIEFARKVVQCVLMPYVKKHDVNIIFASMNSNSCSSPTSNQKQSIGMPDQEFANVKLRRGSLDLEMAELDKAEAAASIYNSPLLTLLHECSKDHQNFVSFCNTKQVVVTKQKKQTNREIKLGNLHPAISLDTRRSKFFSLSKSGQFYSRSQQKSSTRSSQRNFRKRPNKRLTQFYNTKNFPGLFSSNIGQNESNENILSTKIAETEAFRTSFLEKLNIAEEADDLVTSTEDEMQVLSNEEKKFNLKRKIKLRKLRRKIRVHERVHLFKNNKYYNPTIIRSHSTLASSFRKQKATFARFVNRSSEKLKLLSKKGSDENDSSKTLKKPSIKYQKTLELLLELLQVLVQNEKLYEIIHTKFDDILLLVSNLLILPSHGNSNNSEVTNPFSPGDSPYLRKLRFLSLNVIETIIRCVSSKSDKFNLLLGRAKGEDEYGDDVYLGRKKTTEEIAEDNNMGIDNNENASSSSRGRNNMSSQKPSQPPHPIFPARFDEKSRDPHIDLSLYYLKSNEPSNFPFSHFSTDNDEKKLLGLSREESYFRGFDLESGSVPDKVMMELEKNSKLQQIEKKKLDEEKENRDKDRKMLKRKSRGCNVSKESLGNNDSNFDEKISTLLNKTKSNTNLGTNSLLRNSITGKNEKISFTSSVLGSVKEKNIKTPTGKFGNKSKSAKTSQMAILELSDDEDNFNSLKKKKNVQFDEANINSLTSEKLHSLNSKNSNDKHDRAKDKVYALVEGSNLNETILKGKTNGYDLKPDSILQRIILCLHHELSRLECATHSDSNSGRDIFNQKFFSENKKVNRLSHSFDIIKISSDLLSYFMQSFGEESCFGRTRFLLQVVARMIRKPLLDTHTSTRRRLLCENKNDPRYKNPFNSTIRFQNKKKSTNSTKKHFNDVKFKNLMNSNKNQTFLYDKNGDKVFMNNMMDTNTQNSSSNSKNNFEKYYFSHFAKPNVTYRRDYAFPTNNHYDRFLVKNVSSLPYQVSNLLWHKWNGYNRMLLQRENEKTRFSEELLKSREERRKVVLQQKSQRNNNTLASNQLSTVHSGVEKLNTNNFFVDNNNDEELSDYESDYDKDCFEKIKGFARSDNGGYNSCSDMEDIKTKVYPKRSSALKKSNSMDNFSESDNDNILFSNKITKQVFATNVNTSHDPNLPKEKTIRRKRDSDTSHNGRNKRKRQKTETVVELDNDSFDDEAERNHFNAVNANIAKSPEENSGEKQVLKQVK